MSFLLTHTSLYTYIIRYGDANFAFFCENIKFLRKISLKFGALIIIVYLYHIIGKEIATFILHLLIALFIKLKL